MNNSLFFPQRFRLRPIFAQTGIKNKPTSRTLYESIIDGPIFCSDSFNAWKLRNVILTHKKTWDYLIRSSLILLWLILPDLTTETYSQPWYTSEMEHHQKLVTGFQPLPISTKISISDVWHGSEYASVLWVGLIDVQQSEKIKFHVVLCKT